MLRILEMKAQARTLHFDWPFDLFEGSAMRPGNSHLQVLTFRQDGIAWSFSCGLPITRQPARRKYKRPFRVAASRPRLSGNRSYVN
jgi:hypothetical protein